MPHNTVPNNVWNSFGCLEADGFYVVSTGIVHGTWDIHESLPYCDDPRPLSPVDYALRCSPKKDSQRPQNEKRIMNSQKKYAQV